MDIVLKHKHWSRIKAIDACIYTIGYIVSEQGDYLSGDDFCVAVYDHYCNLSQYLHSVNGQYSIIIFHDGELIIASDISNLYSVFFNDRFVSDDTDLFIDKDAQIDEYAVYWLEKFGSTWAGGTLLKGVKQSKGGVIIRIKPSLITEESFTRFLKPRKELSDVSKNELANTINSIFSQLKPSLLRKDGTERQIVLSLSGGYDSRIVAERLVNYVGHKNLLFFTIGCNASEQQVALSVSERLGVRCIRIDMEEEYPTVEKTSEILTALRSIGNLTCLHYVADFFAIKSMRRRGLIENDAIFMTGHIGDTLGGSAVRQWCIEELDSPRIIAYKIILSEFSPICILDARIRRTLRQKLEELNIFNSKPASPQLGMSWSLLNSSTNRIASECNNYIYWEYEVRSPLFSQPLLNIVSRMNYKNLTSSHCLYNETLEELFFKPAGILFPKKKVISKRVFRVQLVKNMIKAFLPRWVCKKFKKHSEDLLQENHIIQFMIKDLIQEGVMKDEEDYMNINEIMDNWYLFDVKCRLKKATNEQ